MGVGWGEGWVSGNLRDGKPGVLGSRYQWGFPPLLKIPFFRGLGVGVGVWGLWRCPPPLSFQPMTTLLITASPEMKYSQSIKGPTGLAQAMLSQEVFSDSRSIPTIQVRQVEANICESGLCERKGSSELANHSFVVWRRFNWLKGFVHRSDPADTKPFQCKCR